MQRYWLLLPSLLTGLWGVVWLWFRPFPFELRVSYPVMLLVTVLLVAGLLGLAYLLERTLPSFQAASRLLERALASIKLSLPLAFVLAALSAISEELFFRAALLPLIGVWGQALVFGLMHSAPRKAWSYTVFTFFAGLAFGYATVFTGSLWPAILAHFGVNLQGFLELRRLQAKRQSAFRSLLQTAPKQPIITATPALTAEAEEGEGESERAEDKAIEDVREEKKVKE
jgi:hypothetical protein